MKKVIMLAFICGFFVSMSMCGGGGGGSGANPVASFTSSNTNLSIDVDASGSTDAQDAGESLQVRWDWTNDGVWDTTWTTTKTASHSYSNPGSYVVKLEVKDTDGMTGFSSKIINVAITSGGMALIPAGCFNMGDAFNEGGNDELPVHNVCITGFYMDMTEVTNAAYKPCVYAGACTAPLYSSSYSRASYYGYAAYDDFPVIYVSWAQATAYCAWAGKRLPTEAEWEYAARGGLSGKRFPWGDEVSGSDANYAESGDPWDNDTSPVGYYAANGYGLYDMAGNVYEWVNDWYQIDYYSFSPANDPPGPATGTYGLMRGGTWFDIANGLRVAYRYDYSPTDQRYDIGFRCAGD